MQHWKPGLRNETFFCYFFFDSFRYITRLNFSSSFVISFRFIHHTHTQDNGNFVQNSIFCPKFISSFRLKFSSWNNEINSNFRENSVKSRFFKIKKETEKSKILTFLTGLQFRSANYFFIFQFLFQICKKKQNYFARYFILEFLKFQLLVSFLIFLYFNFFCFSFVFCSFAKPIVILFHYVSQPCF